MPEIVETVIYQLHELSDAAKENARAWYREGCLDDDWYDFVYADFETICAIFGVTLKTNRVRLLGGGSREKPRIFFSGFWSQGDGASFDGLYAHTRQAPKAIRRYAPQDAELHAIADALEAIQRRNFYQLHADVRHQGHYYHAHCMAVSVERGSPSGQSMTGDAEDIVVDALRDLARWLYRQLEREYEYRTSDDVVDETIAANEYAFTESGRRFG